MVKEKKNYSYFPLLCANVLNAVKTGNVKEVKFDRHPKSIAPTIAALPASPTSQLIQEHKSRF